MTPQGFGKTPQDSSYDAIIAGRVIMDASTAWFLTDNPDFNGSVLVVERDECYRDGAAVFDWRRQSRERGVEYIAARSRPRTPQGEMLNDDSHWSQWESKET